MIVKHRARPLHSDGEVPSTAGGAGGGQESQIQLADLGIDSLGLC